MLFLWMHAADGLSEIKTVVHNDENFKVCSELRWTEQNLKFFQILKNANEYAMNRIQHKNTSVKPNLKNKNKEGKCKIS